MRRLSVLPVDQAAVAHTTGFSRPCQPSPGRIPHCPDLQNDDLLNLKTPHQPGRHGAASGFATQGRYPGHPLPAGQSGAPVGEQVTGHHCISTPSRPAAGCLHHPVAIKNQYICAIDSEAVFAGKHILTADGGDLRIEFRMAIFPVICGYHGSSPKNGNATAGVRLRQMRQKHSRCRIHKRSRSPLPDDHPSVLEKASDLTSGR